VTDDLALGTVYSSGLSSRILVGYFLDESHRCTTHNDSEPIMVLKFTDTNHSLFAPSLWCEWQTNTNGYSPDKTRRAEVVNRKLPKYAKPTTFQVDAVPEQS
jgi:hypothetical protein